MCVGDFSVSLEMAERGETYQTSGGECSAVRYGLSDSCLRLAAYGPFRPAAHILNGDGQAKEVLCFFFSGLKAARWLLGSGDWEWI